MNNNISMVITDMDRTLLNDDGIITEKNLNVISKLKKSNIKFAIATGRGKEALCRFLETYNILHNVDYIISMNGVSFYDLRSKESYNFDYLDESIIKEIYNMFKSYNISFVVHENNTAICSKKTIYTDIEAKVNNYAVNEVSDFTKILTKKYPKLMLIGEKEILDEVGNKLLQISKGKFNFFKSHDFFLEIVKSDVSKGNALVKLCGLKNIEISTVMAFGDNSNDLDMIKYAGIGVAVSNAQEELKLQAEVITKSNNEDGFAYACTQLLNLNELN